MDDKFAVARTLREIGLLLELKGENRFRARAYETGARALEELREEIPALLAEHRLTELPGIGPALASVISELATTGRCSQLDRLRQEVPRGALELAELEVLRSRFADRDPLAPLADRPPSPRASARTPDRRRPRSPAPLARRAWPPSGARTGR